MSDQSVGELAKLEHAAHRPLEGLWRPLYIEILQRLEVRSVLDLGAGSGDLLVKLNKAHRRVAVDSGDRWRGVLEAHGVEFHEVDLNQKRLPDLEPVDAVVCTDVLEHLLFPRKVLEWVSGSLLGSEGLLITHVPNEFTLRRSIGVMLGVRDNTYFHPHCDEDEDPHLRRFTDIGFKRLLSRFFKFNERFSHLNEGRWTRMLHRLHIPVPYCFQPGPGYVSTSSPQTAARVHEVLTTVSSRTVRASKAQKGR